MPAPDVRAALRLLEFAATLRRYGPPTIDDAGLRTRGDFVDSTIRLVAWPTGSPNGRPPEGQQDGASIEGCSREQLRAADMLTGQPGDVLLLYGTTYEVDNVRAWPGPGPTGAPQFYEFHATQVELELDAPVRVTFGPELDLVVG